MSEQHTPTPWSITGYGNVEHSNNTVRLTGFALSSGDEPKANSQRIVLCVNFCEGISNEDIERLQGVENGLARVISRAKEFKQQRDDLLAALKEVNQQLIQAWENRTLPSECVNGKTFATMSAAIEKAES